MLFCSFLFARRIKRVLVRQRQLGQMGVTRRVLREKALPRLEIHRRYWASVAGGIFAIEIIVL